MKGFRIDESQGTGFEVYGRSCHLVKNVSLIHGTDTEAPVHMGLEHPRLFCE